MPVVAALVSSSGVGGIPQTLDHQVRFRCFLFSRQRRRRRMFGNDRAPVYRQLEFGRPQPVPKGDRRLMVETVDMGDHAAAAAGLEQFAAADAGSFLDQLPEPRSGTAFPNLGDHDCDPS